MTPAKALIPGILPVPCPTLAVSAPANIKGEYSHSRSFLSNLAKRMTWLWVRNSGSGGHQAHSLSKKPWSSAGSSSSGGAWRLAGRATVGPSRSCSAAVSAQLPHLPRWSSRSSSPRRTSRVSWLGPDDLLAPPMKFLGFPAQHGTKLNILLDSLLEQEQHDVGVFVESFCQPTSH